MDHEAIAARGPRAMARTDSPGPRGAPGSEELWRVAAPWGRAAFAALYREYVTPVYRYLYQQVGNPHDAEDLTATTFSKALATLGRYEEQGSFAAWLFSIARHTLRDYQRRRRPQVPMEEVAGTLVDPAPPPEAQVLQAEQARTLHRLIQQLPPDQREALELRVFGELRTAEVATVLGRSEGAVKMLVHRAVTRLRDAYNRGEPA